MNQERPKRCPRQPKKGPRGLKKGPRQPDIVQRRCKTAQERPKIAQKEAQDKPQESIKPIILKTHVTTRTNRALHSLPRKNRGGEGRQRASVPENGI